MEIEMVFNELSLKTPAADEHTARNLMSELIDTIRRATVRGVKRKLRSKSDLDYSLLAPNYSIVQWRNDRNVEREERNFFRVLQDKNDPPLLDMPNPEIEISYQGEQGIGIAHALVFNALAVSLLSEAKWDCSRLDLAVRRLDDNEELIDEEVEIIHASRGRHVEENADWIENSIETGVGDGLEIWNQREKLFPNLEFCQAVGKQLQSLGVENPILQTVKNRLFALQKYCNNWQEGAFIPEEIGNISPESQVTLQNPKYRQERTFICPDGNERTFSWHVKLSFGWRIYFFTQEPGKMIIGYIGCHLRTVKYGG